jgi:hypothetical protein
LVTEWAKADAVLTPAEEGDVVGLAAVAGLEAAELEAAAGAELEVTGGAELELELEPELQAAAPITTQAPTAAMRHLEPPGIRRDIPVERIIAPFRLSAVNSPVSGLPTARCGLRHWRTELIDQ